MKEFNEFNDLDDAFELITMKDEDGNEQEYLIVASAEENGINYFLVIESASAEDDEAEAVILKEIEQEGEDGVYEVVQQDAEFIRAASLFQDSNEDYEIEL